MTDEMTKIRSLIFAVLLYSIEFLWKSIKHDTAEDDYYLEFKLLLKMDLKNTPPLETFLFEFLFSPLFINHFYMIVQNQILRILLFPVNVWICQMIKGYGLMWFYHKKERSYAGDDVYMDGFVKISRYKLFWILGGLIRFSIPVVNEVGKFLLHEIHAIFS
eukprot:gene8096-12557_t